MSPFLKSILCLYCDNDTAPTSPSRGGGRDGRQWHTWWRAGVNPMRHVVMML